MIEREMDANSERERPDCRQCNVDIQPHGERSTAVAAPARLRARVTDAICDGKGASARSRRSSAPAGILRIGAWRWVRRWVQRLGQHAKRCAIAGISALAAPVSTFGGGGLQARRRGRLAAFRARALAQHRSAQSNCNQGGSPLNNRGMGGGGEEAAGLPVIRGACPTYRWAVSRLRSICKHSSASEILAAILPRKL